MFELSEINEEQKLNLLKQLLSDLDIKVYLTSIEEEYDIIDVLKDENGYYIKI